MNRKLLLLQLLKLHLLRLRWLLSILTLVNLEVLRMVLNLMLLVLRDLLLILKDNLRHLYIGSPLHRIRPSRSRLRIIISVVLSLILRSFSPVVVVWSIVSVVVSIILISILPILSVSWSVATILATIFLEVLIWIKIWSMISLVVIISWSVVLRSFITVITWLCMRSSNIVRNKLRRPSKDIWLMSAWCTNAK